MGSCHQCYPSFVMEQLIALVDCNNFYVSCERVFRPDLIGKPVAVLSNNDGCIVARSQEVKDFGVKMGVPLFQIQELVNQHNIHLFSSNYTLYADMSSMVMSTLEMFSPNIEIYSIDEAFLNLTGVCHKDPITYAHQIKRAVIRTTGIPVCVGMGATKTLAKLANFAAKKWRKTEGVLDLTDPIRREKLMRIVPVREIWGIGSKTAEKLNAIGINTVWDLASQPSKRIQTQFNIVVARIVLELNGISCLDIEGVSPDKQQIVCSRSFSSHLVDRNELASALSNYCSRAAEKLRKQQSVTGCITVFIRTNPFSSNEPQYQRSASLKLSVATADSRIIITMAKRLLTEIFKDGYRYHKCGVQLSNIKPASGQFELFDFFNNETPTERPKLMTVVDQINKRFPKSITVAAAAYKDQAWKSKADKVSPSYTTDWNELPKVGELTPN